MRPDNAVPDVQLLKRFLLGELSRDESEPIECYLEQHPELASTPAELVKEDTLISSLRDSAGRPVADPPELAGLMDKLARLRPTGEDATQGMTNGGAGSGDAPELAPPQGPGEIGRLGGYRVLQVLGAGGMGMVYQAEDVHLQRPIALKVMKPEVAKNPANRERFLREARAAAKLKSDHVVNIYQAGEERQIVFLAMEFLEGMSLDEWLKKGRNPTPAQAARMGRQIALGLADAHACGLIHRDIKPGNIWLDSRHQGRIKLLDFGLARGDKEDVQLTQSGAIVGTPAYMAPEQARGERVDHRADLFSLGVVLYRLTTGQLPFRGDNTMSMLMSLAVDTPKPPRELNTDLPPRLASMIERLLSKDREQRPATAKAVADELAIIEREATQPTASEHTMQVVSSAPVVRAAPAAQRSKRLRWLVAASLLLLLGGVAAAIVVIIRDKQGNKIAEIEVPPGGEVQIKDHAQGKEEAKKLPAAKAGIPIAAPLPALLPGEPLSPTALVQRPAKLLGVRSWTIALRDMWWPTDVAYRPDGKRLAVGGYGGVIHIWDPQTGQLVQVLCNQGPIPPYPAQTFESRILAWSPDGRVLATWNGWAKQTVLLWEAETGRLLRTLEAPETGEARHLAWSPDGKAVLARFGGYPNGFHGILSWNVKDGKPLHKISLGLGPVAFSPDGKRFAGVRWGSQAVCVWDLISAKEVRKLGECKGQVFELAWSPDGKALAAGSGTDGVHLWEAETGKEILHRSDVSGRNVSWSPDSRSLAISLPNSWGVVVMDAARDAKPRRLDLLGEGPAAWSPDGKTIAWVHARGPRGDVNLYDAATGKPGRTLSRGIPCLETFAWAADGRTVAVIRPNGAQIPLLSTDTGQLLARLENAGAPFAWSPDGKTLATTNGSPNHAVLQLWDSAGKLRSSLKDHQADIAWLAWSPDGKRLASSSIAEKRILLWDGVSGQRLRELGPFPGRAEDLTWSPDSRLLAFNVPGVGWHFWDLERDKLVNDPKQWKVWHFVFAPDGRTVLVAPNAGEAYRLRDLATGKDGKEQLPALVSRLSASNLSPDGRLLAISASSGGVELWRGDLQRRVRTLKGRYDPMQALAFAQDGKLVAGLAGDHLHVWETDTGRLRGILLLSEQHHGLTISPEGYYTGDDQVERGIVMVVQKDDGTQEVLEPADFEQKYGFKNKPNKVHLLQPLPPPLYPLPGMPMGPNALVREPAELPDANAMSWTVETVNSRGTVIAVAYRPDGKLLATGGDDGTIRVWDTSNGKLVRMLAGEPVGSLSWSKDGKVLTALRPGDIQGREWDADTGRLLRRVLGAVTPGVKTARSPDGKQTATADDKGVRITDTATGKPLHALEETGHIRHYNCSWSPDGRTLAFAYQFPGEAGLRVVKAATGRPGPALAEYERAGVWSPDGKIFATCGRDGRAHLLEAGTYRLLRTLEGDGGDSTGLAWSADGKRLAMSAHSALHVWSVQTGKQLWQKDKRAIAVAWSPDGRRLATTDNGNDKAALRLWEAETGKLLHEHPLSAEGALAWSPDGKRLVALPMWGEEGLIIDAETGAVQRKLKAGVGNCCVRWSSEGKTLTSLDNQGQLREWDATTGEARRTTQLPGVVGYVSSAAWLPNSELLAWASGDAIHLHDAAGAPLGVLLPLGAFGQLAVTPDGRFRGNARIERAVRMVVQKRDGTSETLTVGEFEQKYGFKNDPATVRLMDK